MAGQQRKQGARQNDATGRKRDELNREHAEEIKAREGEISTVAAQRSVEEDVAVRDPQTGEILNQEEVDTHLRMAEEAEAMRRAHSATLAPGTRQPGHDGVTVEEDGGMYVVGQEETPVQTNDTEIIGKGIESPSEVVGGTPADAQMRRVVDVANPPARAVIDLGVQKIDGEGRAVDIRVNEDIQEMTFGAGNFFTFEAGRKYRVPKALADHLEEKGYLWH